MHSHCVTEICLGRCSIQFNRMISLFYVDSVLKFSDETIVSLFGITERSFTVFVDKIPTVQKQSTFKGGCSQRLTTSTCNQIFMPRHLPGVFHKFAEIV